MILFEEQQEIQLKGKLNVLRKPMGKEDRRLVWLLFFFFLVKQTLNKGRQDANYSTPMNTDHQKGVGAKSLKS